MLTTDGWHLIAQVYCKRQLKTTTQNVSIDHWLVTFTDVFYSYFQPWDAEIKIFKVWLLAILTRTILTKFVLDVTSLTSISYCSNSENNPAVVAWR